MRTGPDSRACKYQPGLHLPSRQLCRNATITALFLAAFASMAQDGQPAPKPAQAAQVPANAVTQPAANSAKAVVADQQKKQITSDSSQLLNMAIALKAEVDKTNKDTLSLNVIRKADEIEKLAHSVKEKIKSAGPG
jgi:nitric oxide reductase activation protein